jgi:hypothetical protein
MTKRDTDKPRREHYFFLNPYEDAAFTKCPQCERPTKLRKFPLVIHIEPRQLFVLNKTCRYCERCDLIIAKKAEVESLMAAMFAQRRPPIVGNDYFVFGVLERKDWREGNKGRLTQGDAIECVIAFKDVLNFKLILAGWYYDPKAQQSKR